MRTSLPSAAAVLLLVGGCCRGVPPRDRAEALFRVNSNLERIDQPVHCACWVSCKFRDSNQRMRRFPAHDAILIFHRPRSLILDIKSLAGVIAEFGSNDSQYWLWIEPEIRKLWIGRWENVGMARRLPIPPDQLLDALMMRPIPETLEGGRPPELRMSGFQHWLVFRRLGAEGRLLGTREIRVSHCEPYQPREIIDRAADGRVLMHAKLKTHRRIDDEGPYIARSYVIHWPQDDAELRLDILRARFRPDLIEVADDLFESPVRWDGEIERLDASLQPSARLDSASGAGP